MTRLVTTQDIRTMAEAARGDIGRVFLHWSAGYYTQLFDDYHIMIDGAGGIHAMADDLTTVLSHTWHHNTGSCAVSLACCYDATPDDLGDYAPTEPQIEATAQVIAALCAGLGLPIDEERVTTHAEIATVDGYGPNQTWERWDLWILYPGDEPGSGGNILRGKANWYLNEWGANNGLSNS